GGRAHRKGRSSINRGLYENPRLDRQLKYTFEKIGVPEPTPFRPDPFQLEALDKIGAFDVLVSAPTGSGKTWIASQAISQYLSKGLRTWYASPLKALSNSIYQEFCHEFGIDQCGILTGDRKENSGAPIIVGTTEILRNQLYDAMHEGTSIQADLVILDEAHYLSDPDRGVVWEEVLIYLPPRVRLLLLSATISNAEEIFSWLGWNRGTQTRVVRSHERPVPLEMLFLFPDGLISPLAGRKGLASRVRKFLTSQTGRGRRRGPGKLNFGEIIKCLKAFDLLPAIFFLKSRRDCDQALLSCYPAVKPHEFRERFKGEVRSFLRMYPHLEGHRQMTSLLESMVGSHHAGQLPYWKILIEKMMSKGCLEAIFSTSTVAAGVNFPARTVVLVQSDRYNGHEFANLTATELHQMTGRAGRRGKDNIGFALIVPGLHQDPQLIYELKDSPPEPLMSQIHINFSMTLNLLLSHRPLEVKDMLDHSFASFQEQRSGSAPQNQWDSMLKVLKKAIPKGKCDTSDPYEILENIRKKSGWQKEARKLATDIRNERLLNALQKRLKELPCEDCEHFKVCHTGKNRELKKTLRDFRSLAYKMEGMEGGLWMSFKRYVRFLKETGFLDEMDRLTPDGYWASKLRLDHPLLIAEAIRKGGFSGVSPEVMAGCIAPFVWDRGDEVELKTQSPIKLNDMEETFNRILESIEGMR
ncbi:MAG: DEAD/DEAH box helicase, partial [Deltaproteobacteria bacterium]|nr:DEAD/DEAH box helicase [Deltaproteobacteria bacterium]